MANFQRRTRNYETLMALLRRPGLLSPAVNRNGRLNYNSIALINRMWSNYNNRHGTKLLNHSTKTHNSISRFAVRYKRNLNNNNNRAARTIQRFERGRASRKRTAFAHSAFGRALPANLVRRILGIK